MANVTFIVTVFQAGQHLLGKKTVKREIIPRIGEYVEHLDGWGAKRVTEVMHTASREEIEVRLDSLNLREESSYREAAEKQGWKVEVR